MKFTESTLEKIRNILNENSVCQKQMEVLKEKAIENNVSVEQWEEMKVRIMTTLFYKMCEMIPEYKDRLGAEIYEQLSE